MTKVKCYVSVQVTYLLDMQMQKTGTLKQCPGKIILEFELITAAVDRGVEGKIFKGFCSFTYRRHRFLN